MRIIWGSIQRPVEHSINMTYFIAPHDLYYTVTQESMWTSYKTTIKCFLIFITLLNQIYIQTYKCKPSFSISSMYQWNII